MVRCLLEKLNRPHQAMDSDDDLFDFPCEFPIKAMGKADMDFDSVVVTMVRRHAPDLSEGAVSTRLSRDGNYMSVTVTVTARSREQLDAIYMDLTAHDRVLMAL